jgi:Tat protein secretion system quality control protein TatD with DNase activity
MCLKFYLCGSGFHPWFTHFIALKKPCSKEEHYKGLFLSKSPTPKQLEEFEGLYPHLPEPIYLDDIIEDLRRALRRFPRAHVGEVGLDKIFRVSHDYYASPRVLTSFNIPMDHQIAVLSAQIDLAVELGRHVSIHSVRAQLPTVDLLKKMADKHGLEWSKISIQLHSCGLSPQMWADLHTKYTNVFISLSVLVNKRTKTYKELLQCCDANRLLVESDMNQVDQCISLTCEMLREIATVRGWAVETEWVEEPQPWAQAKAVLKLEKNFNLFLKGNHGAPLNRRKGIYFDSDLDR